LEATLRGPQVPTWAALRIPLDVLRRRSMHLRDALAAAGVAGEVVPTAAVIGGGGAPGLELASCAIALDAGLAAPLRTGDPPVLGRLERGKLLVDLRCVQPGQDEAVLTAVLHAAVSRPAQADPSASPNAQE
jgi:L-seryl-tRNA(Ser) seleniumtransferase